MKNLLRKLALFACAWNFVKVSSELTPVEKKIYQEIAQEVEAQFSEKSFEEAVERSGQKAWLDKFLPYYERSIAIEPPKGYENPLDEQIDKKSLIEWAVFLLNPTNIEEIKKNYKQASLIVHPDKTGFFAQRLTDNIDPKISAETEKTIRENANAFGAAIFKLYSAAKNILEEAESKYASLLDDAFLPANRETYRERYKEEAMLSPAQRKLREVLSPEKTSSIAEFTFRKVLTDDINELKQFFSNPAEQAALELLYEGFPFEAPSEDLRRELQKQIIPKVKERINFYTTALKDPKRSPLVESFKSKTIETVFDIVAYNAYLNDKFDTEYGPIPSEIAELGAIIHELYINLLLEFYGVKALKDEAFSNDPQEFYAHYSIYGWGDAYHPSKKITTDGISWGITIKNPARIKEKFKSYSEAPTALRRARELIKKLPSLAKKYPELKEKIDKAVAAIRAELALGNKQQDTKIVADIFLGRKSSTQKWIDRLLNNPHYYGPIAWEIDNNGVHRDDALRKLLEIRDYYAERNEYDQFIELIENLPLNPKTKIVIIESKLPQQLSQLGMSLIQLKSFIKA